MRTEIEIELDIEWGPVYGMGDCFWTWCSVWTNDFKPTGSYFYRSDNLYIEIEYTRSREKRSLMDKLLKRKGETVTETKRAYFPDSRFRVSHYYNCYQD